MEPFTLNQAIMSAMLFILGILIGMFLLAGGKWKRRYRDETARREALEMDNETLRRDAREMESLRHAAANNPAPAHIDDRPVDNRQVDDRHIDDRHAAAPVAAVPAQAPAYRKVTPTNDGAPDVVIRRP